MRLDDAHFGRWRVRSNTFSGASMRSDSTKSSAGGEPESSWKSSITSHAASGQVVRSAESIPARRRASSLARLVTGSRSTSASPARGLMVMTVSRSPAASAATSTDAGVAVYQTACLPASHWRASVVFRSRRGDEHLDPALAPVEQPREPGPLDDPAAPRLRVGCDALGHPCHGLPQARAKPIAPCSAVHRRARDPTGVAGALPSVPRPAGVEALCERIVACEASIRARQLAPAADAELLPKNVAVRLHRPGGDAEPLRDLVVGATGSDEDDHVALPGRDRRHPLDR